MYLEACNKCGMTYSEFSRLYGVQVISELLQKNPSRIGEGFFYLPAVPLNISLMPSTEERIPVAS